MNTVIFFTPHFLPRLGGVEIHVSELSRVLANRDWKITIVTLQDADSQALIEKTSNMTIVRVPKTAQNNKVSIWSWIKNYFKTVSADTIIHIHDVGWWCIWQLLFNRKNNFYITFHGWEGSFPVKWRAKLHRLIISWLVKGSIHVGTFIQNFYWDKPSAVVFGGVTLPVKAVIQPLSLPTLQIVFLGRLERENEIELYIKILTELVTLGVKPSVTWVGDGTYRTVCEKWGNVTGMVADTKKYVQSADLVFANSYLSILESQAQGKIVCSMYNNELKKDYLKSFPAADLLIISNSAHDAAAEIKNIASDGELYKQVSKKNAVFAQDKSWNKVADVYEKLWRTK
ncbi:MAG: hypothetical protein QG639_61 [Patescibacteria group bacterium]|jgi:glycosyltransferase involved in cell wall biosynthesis|nr:hypothetical protein [Patescibacteria group bacterium]